MNAPNYFVALLNNIVQATNFGSFLNSYMSNKLKMYAHRSIFNLYIVFNPSVYNNSRQHSMVFIIVSSTIQQDLTHSLDHLSKIRTLSNSYNET